MLQSLLRRKGVSSSDRRGKLIVLSCSLGLIDFRLEKSEERTLD